MSLAVALEMIFSGKGLVAERALEGSCSAVEGQMVFEVIRMQKPGRAVWAGVGALACVFPHVDFQFIIPGGETGKERGEKIKRKKINQLSISDNNTVLPAFYLESLR